MKTQFENLDMKIEVEEIAYHRNGISGNGFHVVLFTQTHEGTGWRPRTLVRLPKCNRMMGVIFTNESTDHKTTGYCAIFDRDKISQNVVAFGNNSWRGDQYEAILREAILEKQKDEDKKWKKEMIEKAPVNPKP